MTIWLHGTFVLSLERYHPGEDWRYNGRIVTESEILRLTGVK